MWVRADSPLSRPEWDLAGIVMRQCALHRLAGKKHQILEIGRVHAFQFTSSPIAPDLDTTGV